MRMNPEEEIDLLKIARDSFSFLRKHGLQLVLFGLAGVAVAAGYRTWRTVNYDSEITFSHDLLAEEYLKPLTESVQRQLSQGLYDSVAIDFNISPEVVKHMTSIKVAVYPFEKTISDQERELMTIQIRTTRLDVLPAIQAGLIHAFQHNSFLQTRRAELRDQYRNSLETITREEKLLDSLKQQLFRNQSARASFDPAGVFYQSVILSRQRSQYETKLQRLDDWTPVVNLNRHVISDQPTWFSLLTKGFLAGVALGLAFVAGKKVLLSQPS
jgi:hypothetical protein